MFFAWKILISGVEGDGNMEGEYKNDGEDVFEIASQHSSLLHRMQQGGSQPFLCKSLPLSYCFPLSHLAVVHTRNDMVDLVKI